MAEEEIFQFDDEEELDEIEYFEIVSLEEIVKLNPFFVLFSNEEIYNYLFSFFKSKSKANHFLTLFTSIIERQRKKANTNNFIVVADAKRGWFNDEKDEDGEDEEEGEVKKNSILDEFISKIKNSNKEQVTEAYNNKNKIWFPLVYDNDSSNVKFKASSTTIIELTNEYSNDRYIIFKDDERDIPIMGVYFYEPVVLDDDYLNEKIVSFLIETKDKDKNKKEFKSSKDYNTFEDLINDYKMKLPLNKIDKDEYHYSNINSIFKKFNKDLDFINGEDFKNLKIFLENLNKSEKEYNLKYSKITGIKPLDLTNKRFLFFRYLKNSRKLADITKKAAGKLKEIYDTRKNEKTEVEYFPIVKELGVLMLNIQNDNYEAIIKNIREIRKNLVINNSLEFLKKALELNEIDEINDTFDSIERKYNLLFNTYKDIFKISFNFDEETSEITKGTNIDDYEGVPVVIDDYKKNAVYINDDNNDNNDNDDNDDNNDNDEEKDKNNNDNEFRKYYYNLEKGYLEALKIVLPFVNKLREVSKLPINYDLITTHLFNIYRGIPSKEMIIREKLKGDYNDSYYKEQAEKSVKYVLSTDSENKNLKEANNEFMKTVIDMIYDVICKWSILTQNDILTNNLLFVKDKCYLACIELWNDYGAPYDMNSKDGVIYYLLCVFKDVFLNEFNYIELDKEYKKIVIDKLKSSPNYNKELEDFNKIGTKKKKENKGLEAGKKLIEILNTKDKKFKSDKMLDAFIEALVFMPAYKYQKIHKYLLGCCLEQIDDNFSADTFINKERKDLKKAKSKFASERVLNKKRYKRFYITKEDIIEERVEFKEIGNYIHYKDFYERNLEGWFKDLNKDNKTYINEETLRIIKEKLRETYLIHYNNYIPNFFSKALATLIKQKSYSFDNYRQVLIGVSHILFIHLNEGAKDFINNINDTIKELDKLNSIINDENITDITQIRSIIVIRGLCLPSYPSINDKAKLVPKIDISKETHRLIVSDINKKLMSIINISKMQTPEEQMNYINKIREENKDKIIAALNKKTREEKDVIKELNKVGIKLKDEEGEEVKEINKEKVEIADDEPEDMNEYRLGEEEIDDDDNLDVQDYGFIYGD
jgi:hypothetical protein